MTQRCWVERTVYFLAWCSIFGGMPLLRRGFGADRSEAKSFCCVVGIGCLAERQGTCCDASLVTNFKQP